MRKTWKYLLLIAASSAFLLTGCRRQPIETESETNSETQTEKITEKQTEKSTEKITEKSTGKQTETEKKTSSSGSANKTNNQSSQKTSVAPSETNATESSSTQICPYCYQSFSTVQNADGTSEYSIHYAQEKAYADMYGIQPSSDSADSSSSDGTNNYDSSSSDSSYDNGYAYDQCPYCGQWFSTAPDASGYSPYGEHLAAESAYAASSAAQQGQQYQECPYCGQWLDPVTYQDHVANLY